jgi:hypothetical protein
VHRITSLPPKKGPTSKSCDMVLSSVHWMQLILECDPQKPVTLTELKKAQIGSVFQIVCCINNKDITSPENWESCILRKVQKETWEVLNVHQNAKVEDDLDLEGDDGLKNTWGLYYKNVGNGNEYVTSFVTNTKRDLFKAEHHDVSPKRGSLCAKATANVQKKADAVTKKTLMKFPTSSLKLGDIILVPLNDVDCAKVDGKNLVKNPPPAPGSLFLGVAIRSASGRDLTRVPKPNSISGKPASRLATRRFQKTIWRE